MKATTWARVTSLCAGNPCYQQQQQPLVHIRNSPSTCIGHAVKSSNTGERLPSKKILPVPLTPSTPAHPDQKPPGRAPNTHTTSRLGVGWPPKACCHPHPIHMTYSWQLKRPPWYTAVLSCARQQLYCRYVQPIYGTESVQSCTTGSAGATINRVQQVKRGNSGVSCPQHSAAGHDPASKPL